MFTLKEQIGTQYNMVYRIYRLLDFLPPELFIHIYTYAYSLYPYIYIYMCVCVCVWGGGGGGGGA